MLKCLHLYLITYLPLGDDNPTFPFHSPSVLSMTNLQLQRLFSELQQHPSAACSSCVVLSPPLFSPSPPLHFAPSTGCICSKHAYCSLPFSCNGEVTNTVWRLTKGGWYWYLQPNTRVDEMCKVPGAHTRLQNVLANTEMCSTTGTAARLLNISQEIFEMQCEVT